MQSNPSPKASAQHTPGPLHIKASAVGDYAVLDAQNNIVAECWCDIRAGNEAAIGEAKANAMLYTAAPALLAVVTGFHRKLSTYVSVYPGDKELRGLLVKCEAAIAKATEHAS